MDLPARVESPHEGLRSGDTDAEAHRIQIDVLRRTDPAERLRIAMQMADEARDVTAAGIAARHPEYSPGQVRWALFRLLHGDELYRAAWPGAPELAP